MEFISPHKHIKNTSTNGTILTEHMLNTNRGHQTPKRTRKIPHVTGQDERKKKGKGRGESGTGPEPLGVGVLKERRGSRICGSPLIGREISWDTRSASGAQRRARQPAAGRTA